MKNDITGDGEERSECEEERLQVDRKRLESMITGTPLPGCGGALPSAEQFFDKVQAASGAAISWPSRLKIGAKTKKDPYVKICGNAQQIHSAKQLISAMLKIKRDRVTLKMEIPFCEHSQIIGRGGRNTQDIMKDTMCHIHFPDSNKHNDAEKNNQVSIAGPLNQVEEARKRLRRIAPVCLTVDLPHGSSTLSFGELSRRVSLPQINVQVRHGHSGGINFILRGNAQNENLFVDVCNKIRNLFSRQVMDTCVTSTTVVVRKALLEEFATGINFKSINYVALHTETNIHYRPSNNDVISVIHISGQPASVVKARRFIISLFPASLSFEKEVPDVNVADETVALAKSRGITINERRKTGQNNEHVQTTTIKGQEVNIIYIYNLRNKLLALPINNDEIPDEYKEMREMLQDACANKLEHQEKHTTETFRITRAALQPFRRDFNRSPIVEPKSMPDPEESPIAHSLLTGAKHIEKQNSDIWKTPGIERQFAKDREKMLFKANRAVYDSHVREVRQPTDLWSGYGFSNSLPADILKNSLQHIWSSDSDDQMLRVPEQTDMVRSMSKEEDEVNEYSHCKTKTSPFHSFHRLKSSPLTNFSASTSLFDSSPQLPLEVKWDIKTFVDPAMVLVQLGCAEYLAQFRDQEIDMEAFLLLDEQNLKDIGVSTLGARKKIINAIIKLRESATRNGYFL
uniref:SAM domain-containing protein n=1 Tax=Steinernema glaseri TaxID=37863 RepID=A0A1I7YW11_9BILA